MAATKRLRVLPSPCTSCPYRKDTPRGIWHPSEYEKLRGYDDGTTPPTLGAFLCHHAIDSRNTVCRGWLTVHAESVAARLAVLSGLVTDDERYAAVKEPLYRTGNEAADAGLRGVLRPGVKARAAIERIVAKKRKG